MDAYHIEGEESPKLDEAVKVAKGDGDREEHEVTGVPNEEANKLHHLGEAKHEGKLSPERILAACLIPPNGSLPASQQQKRVNDKRQGCECGKVEGVGAPWLLPSESISSVSSHLDC